MSEEKKDENAARDVFLSTFKGNAQTEFSIEEELLELFLNKYTKEYVHRKKAYEETYETYKADIDIFESGRKFDEKAFSIFIKQCENLVGKNLHAAIRHLAAAKDEDEKTKAYNLAIAIALVITTIEYGIAYRTFYKKVSRRLFIWAVTEAEKIKQAYEYSYGKIGLLPITRRIEEITKLKSKELSKDQMELISSFGAKLVD